MFRYSDKLYFYCQSIILAFTVTETSAVSRSLSPLTVLLIRSNKKRLQHESVTGNTQYLILVFPLDFM